LELSIQNNTKLLKNIEMENQMRAMNNQKQIINIYIINNLQSDSEKLYLLKTEYNDLLKKM
jgi:hypothetical protein